MERRRERLAHALEATEAVWTERKRMHSSVEEVKKEIEMINNVIENANMYLTKNGWDHAFIFKES